MKSPMLRIFLLLRAFIFIHSEIVVCNFQPEVQTAIESKGILIEIEQNQARATLTCPETNQILSSTNSNILELLCSRIGESNSWTNNGIIVTDNYLKNALQCFTNDQLNNLPTLNEEVDKFDCLFPLIQLDTDCPTTDTAQTSRVCGGTSWPQARPTPVDPAPSDNEEDGSFNTNN